MGDMKTTLELPDQLMREVKIRAAEQNRRLKDVVAELLRRGLREPGTPGSPDTVRNRVRLPLVRCAREATPDQEMNPERAAGALLEEEAHGAFDDHRKPVR
jgi:plasmid stability protein